MDYKLWHFVEYGVASRVSSVSYYLFTILLIELLIKYTSLLKYLNPDTDAWIPHSSGQIRVWVMRKYELYKQDIIDDLKVALSKVHLTADLWTSGNHKSVLGVIGHYINQTGELKHNVLGARELEGSHSGVNQATLIIEIITEFGIDTKLGFFVGDNDGKNDTLCRELGKRTYFKLSLYF